MLFNSLTFLVFFAAVLGFHQLPLPWTWKKLNLLSASYLFYAAWNPPFVALLILAAVVDYHLARWLAATESLIARRAILFMSLALNLGLLAYFKYGHFAAETFAGAFGTFGLEVKVSPWALVLPLGISFYTFETISYLVDVYRRKVEPADSFLDYALFLTFFPHLVAGPIVRAGDFLPQCRSPTKATADELGWGLSLLIVGLFEKMMIADTVLAPVADAVYLYHDRAGFADAWIGTFAFAGQIFCDFAGYSTCAIGVAHCFGFVLKPNFRFPYAADGFADFWRRWHVSLSTWLRDYLYIPLGGNRHGSICTYINLMVTMLLGGLWHGAAWRFAAWGALHGAYLIGERVLRRPGASKPAGLARFGRVIVTFLLVCLAWVFFRAPTFGVAVQLLSRMLGGGGSTGRVVSALNAGMVLTVTAGILGCHWALKDTRLNVAAGRLPGWVVSVGLAVLAASLVLARGGERVFLYFQF